jgi:hypothetical protein
MKFNSEEDINMRRGSKAEKNVFIYCLINKFSNRKICKLMKLSYFRVLQYKKELALSLHDKGISHTIICKNLGIKTPALYLYKDKNIVKTEDNIDKTEDNIDKTENNIDNCLMEKFQNLKVNSNTDLIDTLILSIQTNFKI